MIGAINTVFIRLGSDRKRKYIGTNTDCIGVREAFLQNYPDILERCTGKPALVIGGGGACRSAVYTLWKWLGASKVYLVNRIPEEVAAVISAFRETGFEGELVHVSTLEQARGLETPVLVVGTVPDFPPTELGEVLVRGIVTEFLERGEKGYVHEMCYHPNPVTEFYRLSEGNGWRVIPGTESMIHQGVAQQVLWAEKKLEEFPVEVASGVVGVALEKARGH